MRAYPGAHRSLPLPGRVMRRLRRWPTVQLPALEEPMRTAVGVQLQEGTEHHLIQQRKVT